MSSEDVRTPKHINEYISQYKQHHHHPKSQKLIKQESFGQNMNRSFGNPKKHFPSAFLKSRTKQHQDELNSSYIISLSEYEGRQSYEVGQKSEHDISIRSSIDSQTQRSRRKMIYGNGTMIIDDQQQPYDSTTINNNQNFEMVFGNNKKKQFGDSISTAGSFSKSKHSSLHHKQVQQPTVRITDFKLGKKLGAGKFGEVFIAQHKKTGFTCAIKRINKLNIDQKLVTQMIREIKIQSFLNHPNIVKLYAFFSDHHYIYLLLELCFSGELYDFLKKKRKIPEPYTRNIMQQTLKALDYMHENEIIHRDLKPQNIIIHNGMIKLCDFGWSISSKTMRATFCGTPLYVSPELLKRKTYDNKIDVWSIGILTYELLFGRVPFEITTQRDFIKIVEDEIKFSKATKISNDAKDFILICLKKDPNERYTVSELLEHPFMTQQQQILMAEMY